MNSIQKAELLNRVISSLLRVPCSKERIIECVKTATGVNLDLNGLFTNLRRVGVIETIKRGTRSEKGIYRFTGAEVKPRYLSRSKYQTEKCVNSHDGKPKTVINEEYCINYLKNKGYIILKQF